MTETVGARAGARKSKGKGVFVERIFTTPGVHPYDEVTWEKRDVVQQNWKSGETIFEQRELVLGDRAALACLADADEDLGAAERLGRA